MSRKHFNVFPAVTVKSQFPIPIQLLHCGQGFFLLSGILILPLLEKRPVKNNLRGFQSELERYFNKTGT